ncbi:MAG TPA: DUF3368 domain-containing protein [Anaerolineae bacterium]|nr:DUF3368 domain-containing protein [Anaerolineae bacterium]
MEKATSLPEIVIANSGPLIALASIGEFRLLQDLFGEIVIPSAVYDEVVTQGNDQPGAKETKKADWIKVVEVQGRLAVDLLRNELDRGESEAIVLAKELEATRILIDEKLARRKARSVGLTPIGTLGVILMAKEARLVPAIRPLLDKLRQTPFRMTEELSKRYYTWLEKHDLPSLSRPLVSPQNRGRNRRCTPPPR